MKQGYFITGTGFEKRKNEKVLFCLEAGWKIWYDYGKAAGREEEIRRAKIRKTGAKEKQKKALRRENNCES